MIKAIEYSKREGFAIKSVWESSAVYNTKPTKAHTTDTSRSWKKCLNFIHEPLVLFKKVDYIVSMNEEQKKLKQMREEAKEQRAQVLSWSKWFTRN